MTRATIEGAADDGDPLDDRAGGGPTARTRSSADASSSTDSSSGASASAAVSGAVTGGEATGRYRARTRRAASPPASSGTSPWTARPRPVGPSRTSSCSSQRVLATGSSTRMRPSSPALDAAVRVVVQDPRAPRDRGRARRSDPRPSGRRPPVSPPPARVVDRRRPGPRRRPCGRGGRPGCPRPCGSGRRGTSSRPRPRPGGGRRRARCARRGRRSSSRCAPGARPDGGPQAFQRGRGRVAQVHGHRLARVDLEGVGQLGQAPGQRALGVGARDRHQALARGDQGEGLVGGQAQGPAEVAAEVDRHPVVLDLEVDELVRRVGRDADHPDDVEVVQRAASG